MENTQGVQQSESNQTNSQTPIATLQKDVSKYECVIECAIRRRPGMTALPGQDPAERIYKLGASLDTRTRGNLKGINGVLETLFMPSIIGVSSNAPEFKREVDDFWGGISREVPFDDEIKKEHLRGIPINIKVVLVGKARKEKMDGLLKTEDKINYLNQMLEHGLNSSPITTIATVADESISDYLLINYALKYTRVANSFSDIDKSPKIEFYIFEKAVSVKNSINKMELRSKASLLMADIQNSSNKLNSLLLSFGFDPKDYDDDTDKLIKIDEFAFENTENLLKFVTNASDVKWESKYLVLQSAKLNKLRNPVNTSSYYFGDQLIGLTLEDAINYLDNEEKGKEIKEALKRETNLI